MCMGMCFMISFHNIALIIFIRLVKETPQWAQKSLKKISLRGDLNR